MARSDEQAYIEHPLLTPETIERRLYQLKLVNTARKEHTLVCLPTGLGKTTVSLLVTASRLDEHGGKALLLAPTKPLVEQHARFYREALSLPAGETVVFTGEVSPEDRTELWTDATVVVATPQVIENDLIGGRISLTSVTHCTFDECHRASGEYPYTYIATQYHNQATKPLVTGMSASPGETEDEITQVCSNLGIKSIEVMTEKDADVREYTHKTDVDWVTVELPEELATMRDQLRAVIEERLGELRELGVTRKKSADLSQEDLNRIRGKLQQLIDNDDAAGYQGMSIHAEVMKLRRALELVETQSVQALEQYFERQQQAARSSGASKATQRLVSNPAINRVIEAAVAYDDYHPKVERARAQIAQTLGIEDGTRVIVFTESRDTAEVLTDVLSESFAVHRFVGQSDTEHSDGMTQREQQDVLEAFAAGEFEVLVSTSVAEEGLDVPEVDLVVFYEPVPTAIRSIQRQGRTGRQKQGQVVVLMAEDTRDEAYFWIAQRKEEAMHDELEALKDMQEQLTADLTQTDLTAFEKDTDDAEPAGEPDVEIVVDQRELDADIARTLSQQSGVKTRLETLAVADYICSDRVAVERKTVADFLDTLVGEERSLFDQLGALREQYQRPVLILEGDGLYDSRNVHPNAIRGALASAAIDFNTSILQTADSEETVALIQTLGTREQTTRDRSVSVHGEKQTKTLSEQQEYVVAAVAEIGPVTARALLEAFGSVEAVFTADREALLSVEGVGEVTAERLREVASAAYDPA